MIYYIIPFADRRSRPDASPIPGSISIWQRISSSARAHCRHRSAASAVPRAVAACTDEYFGSVGGSLLGAVGARTRLLPPALPCISQTCLRTLRNWRTPVRAPRVWGAIRNADIAPTARARSIGSTRRARLLARAGLELRLVKVGVGDKLVALPAIVLPLLHRFLEDQTHRPGLHCSSDRLH